MQLTRIQIAAKKGAYVRAPMAEKCALLADRKKTQLRKLERKRRERGDEAGARRASVGAGVAAQIANEIRTKFVID